MAVIDCHHHVWWLDKFPHQFPPSWGTSLNRDFTPDDLRPELRACGIDGTILVQSLDNYDETLHYLDVADRNDFVRAVVGWVPLADPPACARALDALKGRKKFVRHAPPHRLREGPALVVAARGAGIAGQASQCGLVFEAIPVTEAQIETVIEAARRMPDLAIVLNHLGRPPLPEKGWEPWASQMVRAAACPNISVKLSVGGDIVWRWPWSTDEIRRYSDHVMQHFGPRRVMAGSNWPVVLLSGSFQEVWRGIEDLLSGLSAADRAEVLGGSAERIYKLK